MRKFKLTKEEQAIEKSIHEYVPASPKKLASIIRALEKARVKTSETAARIGGGRRSLR